MPILTEEERLGTLVAGRYRVEAILGRGGTGVVFEATHTWTGRRVAVKLLRPEYARDLSLVRRFLQEARTAAGIEHPNVVSVLDMGNDSDGTVYLVLELLEGESLGKKLEREGVLPVEAALELLVPVMDALVLAHENGTVHRDLKPDNVFLRRDAKGRVTPKLLDFGMAKMVDAAWGHATQSGMLVGTPFYMSPEQAEGKPDQGREADVWSMGVLLYRCLSGKLPFYADSPTALLLAIVNAKPAPLHEVAQEVPAAIAAVIDRALVADRTQRWRDMKTLLAELRRAAHESGLAFPSLPDASAFTPRESFDPGPPVSPEPPAGSRGGRIAIAAAVAVVLAAAATFALTRGDDLAPREDEADPVAASAPSEVSVPSASGMPREPTEVEPGTTRSAAEESGSHAVEAAAGGSTPPTEAPRERIDRPRRTPPAEPTVDPADGPAGEEPVPATKRLPGVAREW